MLIYGERKTVSKMLIKRLQVSNFKSFDELDIEMRKLNIVVGANASGKSNFIRVFEFIKNISEQGLENAIALEEGCMYLRNIVLGSTKDLTFRIVYDPNIKMHDTEITKPIGLQSQEAIYEFSLHFPSRGKGYRIVKDSLLIKYTLVNLEKEGEGNYSERDSIGECVATFNVVDGRLRVKTDLPDDLQMNFGNLFISLLKQHIPIPKGNLFLGTPFFSLAQTFDDPFSKMTIYDFDPRLPKKALSITGKNELAEDGSNISMVLNDIFHSKEKKRKFLYIIKDTLPFIDDLNIQKFADNSLLFALRETYESKLPYLPASLLSDGTINITALILALYFQSQSLIILEEPERNIHPHLIFRLVNMLEEVSTKKQILVTTHNPEIVKYAKPEDLLLVARKKSGFSTIFRPVETDEIKIFLQNDIGIDELYVQNLLGVANAQ